MFHHQIYQIIEWASSFNPTALQNEDDVETKFVLPLFSYLGYPNTKRRGKYPINNYQPGKGRPGRKPEIDQIYFSTEDPNKQDKDTSLLIVEAKEPQESNLKDAINQAEFYGNFLEPILLVVTNGQHITVLKRHRFRSNETVFDFSVQDLSHTARARDFYNQLRYEYVERLKSEAIDVLTHKLYIELINVSNRYPDLQKQLAKGDFSPSTLEERGRLVVIKSAVAITCKLPVAFEEGSCSIEFSNIMLRGLKCHLSHNEILTDLLLGLGTSANGGTRRFLKKTEDNLFEAKLGQITVILSEKETHELCDAVDAVFQRYKDNIVKATSVLRTQEYSTVSIHNTLGFNLFSVDRWLWNLMKLFSDCFKHNEGKSEWHIFPYLGEDISVWDKEGQYRMQIWPLVDSTDTSPLGSSGISLIYVDPISYFHSADKYDTENHTDSLEEPSFEQVGPLGIWTAKYTEEWILKQFIPEVFRFFLGKIRHSKIIEELLQQILPNDIWFQYNQRKEGLKIEQLNTFMKSAVHQYSDEIYSPYENRYVPATLYNDNYVPLDEINTAKELAPYVFCIETMFRDHEVQMSKIPASPLRPYYAALANLIRCEEPNSQGTAYMQSKLEYVQRLRRQQNIKEQSNDLSTLKKILDYLNQQITLINQIDCEDKNAAAMLSRIFAVALETGVFHIQQKQLTLAKEALRPLWDQYCFEAQFIEPLFHEQ